MPKKKTGSEKKAGGKGFSKKATAGKKPEKKEEVAKETMEDKKDILVEAKEPKAKNEEKELSKEAEVKEKKNEGEEKKIAIDVKESKELNAKDLEEIDGDMEKTAGKKEEKEKKEKTVKKTGKKIRLSKGAVIAMAAVAFLAAASVGLWFLGKTEEAKGNICFDHQTKRMVRAGKATKMAEESECTGKADLADSKSCDGETGIWKISLDAHDPVKKEFCNPECIVDYRSGEARMEWNCNDAILRQLSPEREGMLFEDCLERRGRAIDTSIEAACRDDEANIGEVGGFFKYPHVCCIPFLEEDRLTAEEALGIAGESVCADYGALSQETEGYVYNPSSKTWWIGLEMLSEFAREGCNPACVVSEIDRSAEINWRCTGAAIPEEGQQKEAGEITIEAAPGIQIELVPIGE